MSDRYHDLIEEHVHNSCNVHIFFSALFLTFYLFLVIDFMIDGLRVGILVSVTTRTSMYQTLSLAACVRSTNTQNTTRTQTVLLAPPERLVKTSRVTRHPNRRCFPSSCALYR